MKPDDGRDQTHLSWYMQSRINELCDRQYGFELDKRTDVDAADVGGIMRFANHACHSTQSKNKENEISNYMCNCTSRITFNTTTLSHVCYLTALRDIQIGEEILFDYCYDK